MSTALLLSNIKCQKGSHGRGLGRKQKIFVPLEESSAVTRSRGRGRGRGREAAAKTLRMTRNEPHKLGSIDNRNTSGKFAQK